MNPPFPRAIGPYDKWLADPATGAIVGMMNPNSGGKDTYFAPISVTVGQLQNPTPEMLAMVDATFALNVAPYTRYYSTGSMLLGLGQSGDVLTGGTLTLGGATTMTIPAGDIIISYASLTVQESAELTVEGQIDVGSTLPA
ncbi:MAG: hypothetical protein WCS70_14065 [Verrucomicrobiota bacterium]